MAHQFRTRFRDLSIALLLPFIAAGVQWLLWPYFQPFIWFLFYPATFLGAWLSGRWGGVLSTLLSAGLAVYVFAPPMFAFQLDNPTTFFSVAVFIIMGFLFGYVFDAWKQANRRVGGLEQLQASEARYSELVQHANSAILRWRVDGTIAFCNEFAQTLFGYRADELLGQPVGILLPKQESTGGDLTALVQDIAAHPERFEQNINENICRDGRRVWIAWTNSAVRDAAGQVVEILAVGVDITAHKLAEEALQASETGLKRSQAAAHVGHWTWDIHLNRVNWSDEMYRIFGLDPIGFSGDLDEVIRTAIHPDDREKVERANTAVSEAGQPAPLDYRVVWPDGTMRTVSALPAEQTRDEHGHVVRLWGIVQDITERKQAEEALKDSEQRFSTAFNISPVAQSVIAQGSNEILAVNDTACRLFGYARPELIGASTAKLNLWQNPAERQAAVAELQATGHLTARETAIRTKSGEARTVLVAIEPIMWQGRPSLISSIIDITERKQAEQRIRYLARLYATLSQVNQTIVRVTDRPALFDTICQIAVDYGEFKLAWIGLFERQTGQVTPVAEHGYGENRLPFRDLNLRDEPFRSGLVGRALASGRVETSDDIQLDPDMAHWQAVAARDNYHAAAAIPIRLQGQVVGVLNLYAADVNFFAVEEEQKLLAEMGPDISFALDTMQVEAERQQVEAALRESERRSRALIEHAPDGIVLVTVDAFKYASPSALQMFGYEQADLLHLSPADLTHPDDLPQVLAVLTDLLQNPADVSILQYRLRHYDGGWRWIESTFSNLLAEPGVEAIVINFRDITARKQAEKKLLESEEKYRDLINGMNDTICVIDFDTTILDVNNAATRVLGYAREELLSMKISAIDAELTAEQIQGLASSMPQDKLQVFETWHRTKDGRRLPVEVSSSLVSYLGRIVIMSIARDITERKEMDAKVRESEEKFRALYENAPLAYQSLNEAGCFQDVNPAWLQTLGYELPDVIGRPFSEFLHPDYVAHFNRNFPEFKRRGYVHGVEFKLKHKAGHYLDVAYEGCIGYWPDGQFRQTYCVFQDVTQRKQAEEALRLSQENFAKAFDLNPAALVITRRSDGKFVKINAAHTRLIGYEPAEIIGRLVSETTMYVNPGDRQEIIQVLQATGLIEDREILIRTKSGTVLTMLIYITPIRFNGEDCMLSALLDITDRKRAEAEIQQLNIELEQRVAQRTAQLATANDRLTELDQLKSKFVSDVSHELRTPVTSLSLYIDLLDHGKPEKRDAYLVQLKAQMARLRTLIDDILDLSRLERERDEGGRSPVDLNAIVEHVTATQLVAAEAAGLTLTCEVSNNLPAVVARPDQLTRAITNLVANAIKYTSRGSIWVQTCLEDGRVCTQVTDTGQGIPADELPHLFERFYRGRAVAQSTIPGTGLGLSIVKEIIESHGGTVEVQSELGQGSTFFIWLPVA